MNQAAKIVISGAGSAPVTSPEVMGKTVPVDWDAIFRIIHCEAARLRPPSCEPPDDTRSQSPDQKLGVGPFPRPLARFDNVRSKVLDKLLEKTKKRLIAEFVGFERTLDLFPPSWTAPAKNRVRAVHEGGKRNPKKCVSKKLMNMIAFIH